MSLDKWLNPEEKKKNQKEKKEERKKSAKHPIKKEKNDEEQVIAKLEKPATSLTKFNLTCPKSKCKYQKIIVKKKLTEKDKTCPKCKSPMKIKEL